MVSVGSGDTRFRKSYKDLLEAKIADAQAEARLIASGSALEASVSPSKVKPRGKTLKDACDLTWTLKWSQGKPSGFYTVRTYNEAVFKEFGRDTLLTDITFQGVLEAVEAWEEKGNGGTSVNHKVSNLSVMLDTAMDQQWITAKPRMIRRKPGKHRIRWMNEAEELRVLTACQSMGLDELRDFIVVAVDTGFRRGELLGLRPNDHFNGQLHLHEGETKSDKPRAVPVTDRVSEILTRRSDSRKTFSLTRATLWRQWWEMKTQLELTDDAQFCVHMLRHTCASRMIQRGVSLSVVKEWMGHANIATTMRYAHLAPDSLNAGRDALQQVKPRGELRVVNG